MLEKIKSKLKIFQNQTFFMFLFLVLMMLVMGRLSPHFLTFENLRQITVQAAVVLMMAAGMTFVIISRGIDLSMGSVVALSSVTTAMFMTHINSAFLGFPMGLFIGAACGIVNGFMIGKLGIPPFVATFGMQGIARGITFVITGGMPQFRVPAGVEVLGQNRILGIPISTIMVLLLYVMCFIILTRTRRGRYTYAVGSNRDAAFLSGINVTRHLIWVYMIAGLCAGLAGITELSRVGSGQPGAAIGWELDAIASVVLGGASMAGGVGNIWGTFVGAFIIVTLRSGLNVLNVNAHWQLVAIGTIVVISVYADLVRQKMRK